MIFIFFYILIMAGYCACGLLLGSYMMRYAEASELELGFMFMLQPLTIFARPFICAKADRYQSHKTLLGWFLLGSSISYIPFIVLPYLMKIPHFEVYLTRDVRLWILIVSHLAGSICFCGTRSLGDALAVNYAKRVGSDFTVYRKYGSMSFGICGYLLGFVNQGWIIPDYVASMVLYILAMFTLAVLVYLWPNEYFKMQSEESRDNDSNQANELPRGRELISQMKDRFCSLFTSSCCTGGGTTLEIASSSATSQQVDQRRVLTTKQQAIIFMILIKRDFRILLFLIFVLYGGFTGYAPQNFVFTYMDQVCTGRGICNPAQLAGLMMISYCIMETIVYLVINALRRHLNYVIVLQVTMVSIICHYYFYGFFLNSVSPYFFLLESLHGLEYGSSLATCVELGYKFANEVELIIPELIERGIIQKNDDHNYVRVSLMATMNGCFTLVYDGVGTIMGAYLLGYITDRYSFTTAWIVEGTLASIGFVTVLVVVLVGKCFSIRPKIQELAERAAATRTAHMSA